MTSLTMNNNRTNRKTLSSQIDRLDATLDGLAENLNDAVAMTIKEVVGRVVREAVETAIKEVLSNPELLRAALAQHIPTASVAQPEPKRQSIKEGLKGCWSWLKEKTVQKTVQLTQGARRLCNWGLQKLQSLWVLPSGWLACLLLVCRRGGCQLVKLAQVGWRHRQVVGISLSVGALLGLGSYLSGPLIASLLSGFCGATLAAGSMIFGTLGKLLPGAEQT